MSHGHSPPVHQTGSYRAWQIERAAGIADLAWRCRVEHRRPETHRLLPFNEPSIVIRRRFDENDRTEDCRLLISPAQPEGGEYSPIPGEEQFAVRLAPELMEGALRLRAAEFTKEECDIPVSIRPVFAPALLAGESGDAARSLELLLRAVVEIAGEATPDSVAHAAGLLRRTSGRLILSELASIADVSSRHLRREFNLRFGMSPRAMARRLRLTSAILEAETAAKPDWAGIAAGHGFSDQPHLIRECRAFLGETPRAIHAKRLAMAVSFNT